jgi:hypothetical protein
MEQARLQYRQEKEAKGSLDNQCWFSSCVTQRLNFRDSGFRESRITL